MDTFFIEFRDPLFGIISFFILIFVITISSYWWGRYKNQEDSKKLDKFLDSFHSLESKDELNILISSNELSEKSWLLLAQSYFEKGEYEKSIEIYNELLKVFSSTNRKENMFLLGKTYFKAGFLQRSQQIFLEILKHFPRTSQALKYLLLVYENLRDYNSAIDVLESLSELKVDTEDEKKYIKTLKLLNNFKIDNDKKIQKLLELYKDKPNYIFFENMFKLNSSTAWEYIKYIEAEKIVDILWYLDKKDLNLDIISKNSYLRELYTARGDVELADDSSVFEFDMLIKLKKYSNATLNFEYICSNCSHSYPFAFKRCSSCHSINTIKVEYSLTKNYIRNFSEENNSFQ